MAHHPCPAVGGVGAAGAFEGCGFSSEQAEPVPWEGSIAQTQPGSFQPCPAHIHGRASPLRALCSPWTCCLPSAQDTAGEPDQLLSPWPALAAHLSLDKLCCSLASLVSFSPFVFKCLQKIITWSWGHLLKLLLIPMVVVMKCVLHIHFTKVVYKDTLDLLFLCN